jgi:GNAT superfamily N-acetyltransferase
MHWTVRTTLPDRPGSLAALATRCGERGINILGVQVFPAEHAVVDELVLFTPEHWTGEEVAGLLDEVGGRDTVVTKCDAQVLRDPVTRWVWAARRLNEAPGELRGALADLLDCAASDTADPAPATAAGRIRLTGADGAGVVLTRAVPFTATERARAGALAAFVADREPALGTTGEAYRGYVDPESGDPVSLRRGHAGDLDAVLRMHARCSAATLHRRYAEPAPASPRRRLARRALDPARALCVLAVAGEEVVGMAELSWAGSRGAEAALLVEDGWQRRGIGTRLLHGLALAASERGFDRIGSARPPSDRAALAIIQRAGFRASLRMRDGRAWVSFWVPRPGREVGAIARPGDLQPAQAGPPYPR